MRSRGRSMLSTGRNSFKDYTGDASPSRYLIFYINTSPNPLPFSIHLVSMFVLVKLIIQVFLIFHICSHMLKST